VTFLLGISIYLSYFNKSCQVYLVMYLGMLSVNINLLHLNDFVKHMLYVLMPPKLSNLWKCKKCNYILFTSYHYISKTEFQIEFDECINISFYIAIHFLCQFPLYFRQHPFTVQNLTINMPKHALSYSDFTIIVYVHNYILPD